MEAREQRTLDTLECYQLAKQVLKEAYKLARRLPDVEKYNLCDQMRRAATSVALNIAEGYGRYHYLDRIRFFYMARGSLMETRGTFEACEAVGYISQAEFERLRELVYGALRSLNGFIRHVRKTRQGQKEFGGNLVREGKALCLVEAEDAQGIGVYPDPQSPITNNP